MNNHEMLEENKKYIMNTYASFPLALEKGEGAYVWDFEGEKYLDFVSGIAVNCLGYNDSEFVENITEQLKKIQHCSNLYLNKPSIELAKVLVENSDFDKVFFCNSGAESVEAALKLCRKYGNMTKGKEAYEIITMKNSFHGRTLATVTATGQQKYQDGFGPLLPGVKYVPYNDFEALEKTVNENTCGIILEAIQGEGGVNPANKEYLEKVRELCDRLDIVMVFDEVQTGIGRTGKLFGYQIHDVKPDIISLAKGLGGGIPIGAMLSTNKIAKAFEPGNHASTFGGNPIATTAGLTVLNRLLNDGLLENVVTQGEYLTKKLEGLKEKHALILDIRGNGLMKGIELSVNGSDLVAKCMEKGLLLVGAGEKVIRFVPPLIIGEKEIDEAMNILDKALSEI